MVRGATQGYQNLKNRDLTPPVMEHPNRWRLDQMLAWEDKRIARAEKEARRSQRATGLTVDLA